MPGKRKTTPSQRRKRLAREVDKLLPAKPSKGGETVVPDRLLKRIVRENSK